LKRVISGLFCLTLSGVALAECPAPMPAMDELKSSESVVIGTVESARMVPQSWDTLDGTEYTVHVDQKVKGKPSGEMKVFEERTDDMVPLVAGTRYLFFLNNSNTHWMVNKCGNSGPMDEKSQVIKQMVHAAGND
jgi:hypothetical protein